MGDKKIAEIAKGPQPEFRGIEIDGVGFVAEPPDWFAELKAVREARVIKLHNR